MSLRQEAQALAAEFDARLREATDLERKEFTQGYFPSALENLGVAVPIVRRLVRELKKRTKGEPPELVLGVARAIVGQGTLEGRNLAYLFLNERADALALLGARELEALGQGMDNWTSVDTFACFVAGPVWREGGVGDRRIERWSGSSDRWWRRAALVATVALNLPSRGGSGDTKRTLAVCERHVLDHDDMVVKGLSWALRSLIGHDAEAVVTFLSRHEEELARRCVREVQSKLVTGLKTASVAARRRKA